MPDGLPVEEQAQFVGRVVAVDKVELRAAESIAKASIFQGKAALAAARLDLSYTKVKAPVAGRIGLANFTAIWSDLRRARWRPSSATIRSTYSSR